MLCDEKICTGCGACAAVCPSGAVRMKSDMEGFLRPEVDQQACNGCRMCEDVCAGVTDQAYAKADSMQETYYAANAKNDLLRTKSSSGGIFGVLAGYMLAQGGTVYGAALDYENGRPVCTHIRIEQLKDLERLHGSKYVQSDINGIYPQIEHDLISGRKVLFSGTPCQTEGVRRYAEAKSLQQDRLFLCDFVCHGVPSPKLWESYVQLLESEYGGKIKAVRFRSKEKGWHAKIENCFEVSGMTYTDSRYIDMFLNNYGMRSACSICRFTTPVRNSDITLGDFWGIEQTSCRELDDDGGTSLMIIHSAKGNSLLQGIKELITIKRCSRQEAVKEQKTLSEPFDRPKDADEFWREYFRSGFSYACSCYVTKNSPPHFHENKSLYTDYLVLLPDGSGSIGDEAMLRGVLQMLPSGTATLLNPDHDRAYTGKLSDLAGKYYEVYLSISDLESLFLEGQTLLIIGADVMDGSCRIQDSLLRLKAAEYALLSGAHVHVFCSFRSCVHQEIINKIVSLGQDNIHWHLRDEISLHNFKIQTKMDADFFPDFAFYCDPQDTNYSKAVIQRLQEQKLKGKTLVGLNFSQHSFDSFYAENTSLNWNKYVKDVVQCIQKEVPDAYFVLISHDVREWEGHLSDVEFNKIAADYIGSSHCLTLHKNTSYPEERQIIKYLDFLISGRMHLSIAAFSSGIIPIVYTGSSKHLYSMSEKIGGMFQSRIGRTDLTSSCLEELLTALQIVSHQKKHLLSCLQEYKEVNTAREAELLKKLKNELERSKTHMDDIRQEAQPIHTNTVNASTNNYADDTAGSKLDNTEQTNTGEQKHTANMGTRITEEDKQADNDRKAADLYENALSEKDQMYNLGRSYTKSIAIIETLTKECIRMEKENRKLMHERDRTKSQMQDLDNRMRPIKEELEIYKSSRLFKLMTAVWGIESILLPAGSRRRRLAAACCRSALHPSQAVKDLRTKAAGKNMKSDTKDRSHKRTGKRNRKRRLHTGHASETSAENGHRVNTYGGNHSDVLKDSSASHEITAYEKIDFPISADPAVSIIIPVYNEFAYTYHCLKSLKENTGNVSYEIILADDCSTDLTREIEQVAGGITVIRTPENKRFLRNCNHAAQYARGTYILFLNNDTEVQQGWLEPLVTLMESREDIGLAGSKLVYEDGVLQEAGGILWQDASAWNYGRGQDAGCPEYNYVKDTDYVSGASMIIRRNIWQQIGGFDERFAPAYYEDSDLAFEVRKRGYRVVYQPASVVKHFEGISNGIRISDGIKRYQAVNMLKMKQKWKEELKTHFPNGQNVFRARERSRDKKIILFLTPHVLKYDKDTDSYLAYLCMKVLLQKGFHIKLAADDFCCRKPYVSQLEQMGIEVLCGTAYKEKFFDWLDAHGTDLDYIFLFGCRTADKYMHYFYHKTNAILACCLGNFMDVQPEICEEKLQMADMIYCCSKDEAEYLRSACPGAEIQALPDMQTGSDHLMERDAAFLWRVLKENFSISHTNDQT